MISIIFPAYNEEKNVAELHRRIRMVMDGTGEPYEIIAVNNASTDRTGAELSKLSRVTIVTLAYNIGQSAGLDAGMHAAKGDTLIFMDADLQNDPADIPRLIAKMREGYDAVVGWRKDRRDSKGRRLFSRFANMITRRIAGIHLHDYGCALRAFKKTLLHDVHLYGVMHVFIPVILSYRGARIAEVPVSHSERRFGTTKYTFAHMTSDIADLLTIKFLYGYAARPLVFFGSFALLSLSAAFAAAVLAAIIKWQGLFGTTLGFSQTPLPLFAALCIMLAFLLLMLGFVVELLIRIYYETKGKTPYQILSITVQ